MTTVINFNFLNFFKLKYDEHNTSLNLSLKNDVRSYNRYFDERGQDYSPEQEEVIDVTPYSHVISEQEKRPGLKMINGTVITNPLSVYKAFITYNPKGVTKKYFQEKGLLVNSYA